MSSLSPVELLRTKLAEFLSTPAEQIPGATNLILLGLSSLNVMRLNTQLRRAGIAVDFDEMIATPTLDAWTDQVESAQAQGAGA